MSRQFMRAQKKKQGLLSPSLPSQMGDIMKMQQEISKELEEQIVEGAAPNDSVKITMNGQQEMLSIKIDPSVVLADEVDMLEDLIVVAYKDALGKAQELSTDKMSKLTGGLNIPGLF